MKSTTKNYSKTLRELKISAELGQQKIDRIMNLHNKISSFMYSKLCKEDKEYVDELRKELKNGGLKN